MALLFGDVEMAAPSLSKFRGYAPALEVFDLPFLFDDVDHVHRFQQSEIGQQLLQTMCRSASRVLPIGTMACVPFPPTSRSVSRPMPTA